MAKIGLESLQNFTSENNVNIGTVLRGIILAYIITLIIFLIFAVLITYSNFPESAIPTVVVATTVLSIMIAGANVARKARNRGWFNGAISGATYMIVLYFISCLALTGFVFDKYVIYMLILGLFTGAFGGIIGINLKGGSSKNKR
ncbi:TIGR04086 family membrane protein [Petroclostridium sp. X23]|uniref:TIGR04086 family membrane protein n=1 Tax=Petroclostridium sp. X23 TaxID=3045146 RepID=UPI0024AE82EA|nr:TIGR04086 family membrane protein [Petroclostridium sp. X23]WHH59030.1 TIGR04086 family membrane protein [Petroclostridium sp. X23]